MSVADLWKLGQIRPGDMVKFEMIDPTESEYLLSSQQQWLNALQSPSEWVPSCAAQLSSSIPSTSILHQDRKPDGSDVLLRTAGDRFILYEVGAMALDLSNRVRVELWDRAMRAANIKGVINYNVAVRSAMVQFDPTIISRNELLRIMVEKDKKLENTEDVQLDITTWKFPVVVDDRWCREAVGFYMKTARKEAVYLPSNVVRTEVLRLRNTRLYFWLRNTWQKTMTFLRPPCLTPLLKLLGLFLLEVSLLCCLSSL